MNYSLFCERIGTITQTLEEISVLEVYYDGVVFDVAFLADFVDEFFARERTFGCEDFAEDVFDDSGSITPFSERVESATDEYETGIFDEFVMGSGDVCFVIK